MQHKLASMLGMPVFMLRSVMPHSEYMAWLSYFRYDEPDVQEMQLAVLSTLVSNGLGGKAKVPDFLIRKPDTTPVSNNNNVMSADAVRAVFSSVARKQE